MIFMGNGVHKPYKVSNPSTALFFHIALITTSPLRIMTSLMPTANALQLTRYDVGALTSRFTTPAGIICTQQCHSPLNRPEILPTNGTNSAGLPVFTANEFDGFYPDCNAYSPACGVESFYSCLPPLTATPTGSLDLNVYSPGFFCPKGWSTALSLTYESTTSLWFNPLVWAKDGYQSVVRSAETLAVCCPEYEDR